MTEPAPHPSGEAQYCKRCKTAFYGGRCAGKHQKFSYTRVIPLEALPLPEWAEATYSYTEADGSTAEGQLTFKRGDAITILPYPGPGPLPGGWEYGTTIEGDVGLVPANRIERRYVQAGTIDGGDDDVGAAARERWRSSKEVRPNSPRNFPLILLPHCFAPRLGHAPSLATGPSGKWSEQ